MKRLTLLLAAVALLSGALAAAARAAEPECEPRTSCFGLEAVHAELSTTQAGAHPDFSISFEVRQDPASPENLFGLHKSYAPVRDISFDLPPGLTGNPNVLGVSQQCTVVGLATYSTGGGCPNGSQVGVVQVSLYGLFTEFTEPLYLMEPPGGETVARLGFIAGIYPTFVDFTVRSEGDYGLTATVNGASPNGGFVKAKTTTWGVPAAPVHDTERMTPFEAFSGATSSPPRPPGSQPLAFMTNPTSCGTGKQVVFNIASWIEPALVKDSEAATLPPISGCDHLPFNPSVSVQPTTRRAASPTGLDITFGLPAPDGVEVLESAHLRDIRIDLPPGMVVNPGSADGLGTCSAEQVGFGRNEAAHCPDSGKLAATEFNVPSLPRPLKGAIYLREPEPGHLLRIWVVADDLGAHIKLPGEIELDEASGQLKSVVVDSPQFPLREVKLLFKSGFRAPLATPAACGTYASHWTFTPWSGTGAVFGDTPMTIDEGCNTGGFSPQLDSGTTNPAAGVHSPFLFTLRTQDGEQNPARLGIKLPPGLTATLASATPCEGAAAVSGSCPAASQIGVVNVADGFGPVPLQVPQPDKRPTAVYLSGPYKGAPLSAVAVVPAQAGPFDLGDQVVRSAITVDPVTAQASIESDPLPQIIQGIPVAYRAVSVLLDRPNFMLNPTSCKEKTIGSEVVSDRGALASPSDRFQVGGCRGMSFKPQLAFTLFGGTHRSAHPALRAVVKLPADGANIAAASVALPHSEFLDQAHINTVCTRVQFAADSCPAGSIYGHAVAKTPLFTQPLQGPVYLRSSSNPLPDLVAALKGPASQPVEVNLSGRIDSIRGGIRNTFDIVPDAPVTSFTLSLLGGKKGLLVNSTNICTKANRAKAVFTGQNGKVTTLHPPLVAKGCKKAKKGKKKRASSSR
jgi:hypothetical protein